ncbi:MAG: trehalose-phosphatase [Bryobacteraceae bacterium]|nr:trehalose-phosphatase [Bryobacteraceae bacterium]
MSTLAAKDMGACEYETSPELWERIFDAMERYRKLFVFADFDGTLSELVEVPAKARLDERAGRALRRLSTRPRISVAVLSGRSVDDVAARIGLPITYGGDHGLELHAPDFDFVVPEANALRARLPQLANRLRECTQGIPGALVEVKRFCASIHYRLVDPRDIDALRLIVHGVVQLTPFEVHEGKCVLEIRPRVGWGKGHAVSWLLERYGASPRQAICLGDDETDEDMFRWLPSALNIRVVDGAATATSAPFCIQRPHVAELLDGLADAVDGSSH